MVIYIIVNDHVVSGYFQVLISQQEPIGCLVALEISGSWWRWSCVSYQSETLTLPLLKGDPVLGQVLVKKVFGIG